MPRPLVTGNGQILVCFDERLVMRDLYYPHVGQLNHIVGRRNQAGIWAEGAFYWMDEEGWDRQLGYRPGSLVTASVCRHPGLGLEVEVCDGVHHRHNIFLRRLRVRDLEQRRREIRVFVTNDFNLDESDVADTALWDPEQRVIYHYKRNRCLLIGGAGPAGGIHQYATGRKRFMGAEGTWRDAEDGHLEMHPISQGAVDSTISFLLPLEAGGQADLCYWIVAAGSFEEARVGHDLVMRHGAGELLQQTEAYWRSWVGSRLDRVTGLPPAIVDAYQRSLLTIRTQVDRGGAILAANDSDILEFNRDHYSYVWPRDGALVAAALDRAGYRAVTRNFYRFCSRALTKGGYLYHKYNPDGTVGSSWHPWVGAHGPQLPIQEDETALVLWALGRSYESDPNLEFLESLFSPLVRPAADFLIRFRDPETHLPLESYDLWEERRGVFTFTTAAVAAGLKAAARIAGLLGDRKASACYGEAAAETTDALLSHLYDPVLGRFVRGIQWRAGEAVADPTPESSAAGVFLLGVLPAADPRVVATMEALERDLWCRTPVGGLARYRDDYYFRVVEETGVAPGNPWIICTLWLARWYVAAGRGRAGLTRSVELLEWSLRHAFPTGLLPEQLDPLTGQALSVAPLTWSHATLVDLILDVAAQWKEMNGVELQRDHGQWAAAPAYHAAGPDA
jgi:GH15 family glucan-1,4-alpha-glucosidase